MKYRSIEVTPLTPHIGAEISGVDLTRPLSGGQVADLKQALADHLAIFFRDQLLDFESHKILANHFGGIHIAQGSQLRDGQLALGRGRIAGDEHRIAGLRRGHRPGQELRRLRRLKFNAMTRPRAP